MTGRSRDYDDFEALEALISLTLFPLRVGATVAAGIANAVEASIPESEKIASDLISAEISTLKAVKEIIERRIERLERRLGEGEEKREKVKVE